MAARVVAAGVVLALAAGCGGGKTAVLPPAGTVSASSATAPSHGAATPSVGAPFQHGSIQPVYPSGTVLPPYSGGDLSKYTDAMKTAAAHGLQVWVEIDLVGPYLQGPDAFNTAVEQLAAEARAVPEITGFKIADELGQSAKSTSTPQQALDFLKAARAALHANAPGKLIAVDLIGYDLGCVPGDTSPAHDKCLATNAKWDARLNLDTVDQIIKSGSIDMIDVTTYMLNDSAYQAGYGITRAAAQKSAFAEMRRRGWDKQIVLNTRKALSWPTKAPILDAEGAAAQVPDFVDVPIAQGAAAVDVWSWSQKWGQSGAVVHLMSPNYATNALWDALVQRHDRGDRLFVHYTPSYKTDGGTVDQDMSYMAKAFTLVFVAAGHAGSSVSTTG